MEKMKYAKEIIELADLLKTWIIMFFLFSGIFFFFNVKFVEIHGFKIPYLYPSTYSLTSVIFEKMKNFFIGNKFEVIVTNPINALLINIELSLFFGFLISFPYLLYKIFKFISPAMYEKEKQLIIKTLIPITILFFVGIFFSLFIITPLTFSIFFFYAEKMGILTFFEANEFISTIIALTIATGIMFTFPAVMVILSKVGIIEPNLWKENWRYAFLIILIISAIITPDGSGVTMLIMTIPLMLLYFIACKIAEK